MKQRFKTREEIIERIDRYLADIPVLAKEAEDFDSTADSYRNTDNASSIGRLRVSASNKRKRIQWRRMKLLQLKEKLQEFDTQQIAGVESDGSVPGV